jgi:hypothetical protein
LINFSLHFVFLLGYFSLVNEKGIPTATQYTTMTQLVRERVYKFLSIDNMQAYTESNSNGKLFSSPKIVFFSVVLIFPISHQKFFRSITDNNMTSKSHYVKITAKAGEVFRLLAVFEDGSQEKSNSYLSSTKKDNLNSIGREKVRKRHFHFSLKIEFNGILYQSSHISFNFSTRLSLCLYQRKESSMKLSTTASHNFFLKTPQTVDSHRLTIRSNLTLTAFIVLVA